MNKVRHIERKGLKFVVTFDEYGYIDTIERNGKTISSAHRDAKSILLNAIKIYAGLSAAGFVPSKP